EADLRARGALSHELGREPGGQFVRLGDRPPDLLHRVGEPALEPQHRPSVGGVQASVHGATSCAAPVSGIPSRCRSNASSRSAHIRRNGASQASTSASGSGRSSYHRRCASCRTCTRPASRSTRSCLDVPGWDSPSWLVSSPTSRGRSRSSPRMRRRLGSARTSNMLGTPSNMSSWLYSCNVMDGPRGRGARPRCRHQLPVPGPPHPDSSWPGYRSATGREAAASRDSAAQLGRDTQQARIPRQAWGHASTRQSSPLPALLQRSLRVDRSVCGPQPWLARRVRRRLDVAGSRRRTAFLTYRQRNWPIWMYGSKAVSRYGLIALCRLLPASRVGRCRAVLPGRHLVPLMRRPRIRPAAFSARRRTAPSTRACVVSAALVALLLLVNDPGEVWLIYLVALGYGFSGAGYRAARG